MNLGNRTNLSFYFAIYSVPATFVCYCINWTFNVPIGKLALLKYSQFHLSIFSILFFFLVMVHLHVSYRLQKADTPLSKFRLFHRLLSFDVHKKSWQPLRSWAGNVLVSPAAPTMQLHIESCRKGKKKSRGLFCFSFPPFTYLPDS